MKNSLTTKSLLVISAIMPMTSCVDDKYDLSDIESTARIEVKDLVVPINLDVISLGNIIEIEEGKAVEIVDGQYAIVQSGNVDAAQINIPAIHVSAPTIDPSETLVYAENAAAGKGSKAESASLRFPLASVPSDCEYSTSVVSEYVVSLISCECTASLELTVSLVEAKGIVHGCDFSDIVFQLPKGLNITEADGGSYNPDNGELYISHRRATGSSITLNLEANGIDFTKIDHSYNNPDLTISEEIYLKSGIATISVDDITGDITSVPTTLTLRTEYVLSDIDISAFTGRIKYDITDVDIPEIDLNNLPDVLTQEGTSISITNPCLYLQLNNPLQQYDLTAQSGLSMTAIRTGEISRPYELDPGQLIVIGNDSPDGNYSYCLSPEMPSNVDAEFSAAQHVGYSSLSNVLKGNGIPKSVKVDLVKPMVPEQLVSDFPLGSDMGKIGGKYKFVAPLSFMDGSCVIYTNDMDGWSDEEFDKITITTLEITMKCSTDVPVALDFTGYPIDVEGNQINDVTITGATIDANAQEQEITLRITGEIQHLDGIRYRAEATVAGSETLAPDMTITLTDIRPVVSGYYEKEL